MKKESINVQEKKIIFLILKHKAMSRVELKMYVYVVCERYEEGYYACKGSSLFEVGIL
jgi:hypothetical protein